MADPVRAALMALRTRGGHFGCPHGAWMGGWNNQRRHVPGRDCPADVPCAGEGTPCGRRCAEANRALGFITVEQPELFAAREA